MEENKIYVNESVIDKLIDANEEKERKIIIMEKYLELIYDLGYDYDGCNTINGLKELIDEMTKLASLGRVCNTTEPMYGDENNQYNILMERIDNNE